MNQLSYPKEFNILFACYLSARLRFKKASKEKYSSLSIPRNLLLCSDSSHNGIIAIESPLSQALNLLECILFAKTDGKVSVSKISVSITDNIQNYNSTLKTETTQ